MGGLDCVLGLVRFWFIERKREDAPGSRKHDMAKQRGENKCGHLSRHRIGPDWNMGMGLTLAKDAG